VGLTGHDTSAQAHVDITGVLDFDIGDTALSIDWRGMPKTGAAFKLTRGGESLGVQLIQATGHQSLTLPSPGKYQLVTSISVDLQSRGSCCDQMESANATISLVPASEAFSQQ
jgi:hypothetical protein